MAKIVDDIDKLLLPRYLLNDVYPYTEGIQLEFKKTFHINQLSKYRETICAFLNTNGGHIIFGILDNCIIEGCPLAESEKDKILLYVDSMYNILKKLNGDSIELNCIKVNFEEIAKNLFIIIISCYKKNNYDTFQFLGGDAWIRMNASNMKTKYGKLYNVQDILNIKNKMYRKHDEIINKVKKDYNKCEEDTIIYINDILLKKKDIEQKQVKKQKNTKYYLLNIFWIILFGLFFGYKNLSV
jgi:predicted HTH transcriptional regulator